jgi:integrase
MTLDTEANRTGNPYPAAAIKLLLLTGARRSEVTGLQWQHVDFEHQCLRLPDSKTGAKVVYLNAPALEILANLPVMQPTKFELQHVPTGVNRDSQGTTKERV